MIATDLQSEAGFTDAELLRRTEAGDEEAFAALYRRHRRNVYRFAAHMSGSGAVADDVTQETFLILIRDPARYDATRGELRSFLLGVARNVVRRHAARLRDAATLDPAETDDTRAARAASENLDPFAQLARDEDLRRLRGAIRSLPAAYREILVLCELEEMSYEQAAQVTGCATGTVRSRLHRARRLLADKLREPARSRAHAPFAAGCLT